MVCKKTFYEILGVTRASSLTELRKAYRFKVSPLHTDRGGDVKLHSELTEAYNFLKNGNSTMSYNHQLELDEVFCSRCNGYATIKKQKGFSDVTYVVCPQCRGNGLSN